MMTLRPDLGRHFCSEISSGWPSAVCTVPVAGHVHFIRFIGGEPMKPRTKVEAG